MFGPLKKPKLFPSTSAVSPERREFLLLRGLFMVDDNGTHHVFCFFLEMQLLQNKVKVSKPYKIFSLVRVSQLSQFR